MSPLSHLQMTLPATGSFGLPKPQAVDALAKAGLTVFQMSACSELSVVAGSGDLPAARILAKFGPMAPAPPAPSFEAVRWLVSFLTRSASGGW
jgi:hypothetical protein